MTASALPRLRGEHRIWRYIDPSVVILTGLITVVGLLLVYSTTRDRRGLGGTYYIERQGAAIVIGSVAAVVVMLVDYRRLREFVPLLYLALLAVLFAVPFLGVEVNGARAWFQFGSLQFQPAEFGKPVLIVALAAYFTNDRALEGMAPSLRRLFAALVIAGVPMVVIMLQPDLGTVLIYGAITAAMIVVAGVKARHLLLLLLAVVLATGAVLTSNQLEAYQKARLTVFLDPDATDADSRRFAYNLEQAQVAISNGGIAGQGLFQGSQNRGQFVPEQQTDFIFTVAGEELGFIGSTLLIALFGLLFLRIWRIAYVIDDPFGSLMCVGVLAMLVFQTFQSIGMTMGIMPITGIPLPLVSYGGSSILTTFACIGLVLGVHMRRYS